MVYISFPIFFFNFLFTLLHHFYYTISVHAPTPILLYYAFYSIAAQLLLFNFPTYLKKNKQHNELSSDIYLPFLVPPSCHCQSCRPQYATTTPTTLRSLPQPPSMLPQPQRYSMPTRNLMPLFQTMPIRTHHSYGRPSATDQFSAQMLHKQIDANRLSLFSSFGKGEPEMSNTSMTYDLHGNCNDRQPAVPLNVYGQRSPLDQRRTPYYYNDLLVGDPSTDLSSHEEHPPEAPEPIERTHEAGHVVNANEEADVDDGAGNEELRRNTLFNANLIGSSNGSLEHII